MTYTYNLSYNFTKYIVKGKTILRPIIPVELRYKNNDSIIYTMLLDSGADLTLLSKDVADSLGINTNKAADDDVYGVTGHTRLLMKK
jgi:hypothetical protein